MTAFAHRALIVGSHGGVGRAVLGLLERSAPGRRLRERLGEVFLADAAPPIAPVTIPGVVQLPPASIESADDLGRLVREHRITQVIDLSSLDTLDCTAVCEEEGAHFLATSVEEWAGRASIPTDEAISRLLPPRRPALHQRSHLIGSGANPGIVNALVFSALEAFAERVGTAPTVEALDLHSVLITEEDTTEERGVSAYPTDVFPMTWSPAHCIEELFEPRAFVARNGESRSLGHAPSERWYRVRCGDEIIEGMAVPHEETTTLSKKLRDVEIAFIYRVSSPARRALAARRVWDHETARTRRLYPPHTNRLIGEDRLGVLLCSRRYGELWMGFETHMSRGLAMGTNATQLQVAAGVLAGWSQLGTRPGIHFVEDLDWRLFLNVATEVLGKKVVVHDSDARPQSVAERAVFEQEARELRVG